MRHQVEHEKGNSTAGKAEKEKHVAESELEEGEGGNREGVLGGGWVGSPPLSSFFLVSLHLFHS